MKNVLILCTGNSCRSQMAQGWMEHMAGEEVNVYSAGVETHGVNPMAIAVMAEAGIDITGHTSNHIDEYRDIDFDIVITVCDHARETCPWFPGGAIQLHHDFPDPTKLPGSPESNIQAYRDTRDAIKEYVEGVIEEYLN